MPGRIAFVPPRFGPEVVGGSEAVSREIAVGLAERGWEVEVLTTAAVNHYTWANDLSAGTFDEDGVVVRRFPTVSQASRCGFRAQKAIQDGIVPLVDQQWTWVSWRFTVPELFEYLLRHSDDYEAIVFSPYMFWTTTACLPAAGDRSIVMPCLHDETYARLDIVRPVLSKPASLWFLSEPEHRLAHALGPVAPHHRVTGAGVHVPEGYDPEGFRTRHGITRPYILYAGRRERDKGWDWLVDTFSTAVTLGGLDLDLVTIGVGEVEGGMGSASVIDLGFVSDRERNDAFAGALAYIQPSRMESFSRTIMESWLAGTPVLAVHGSAVVEWHCERSGGGESFRDATELAAWLRRWLSDPAEAAAAAERGRRYVLEQYTWPVVLDRIEEDLQAVAG